jgi:hypothetical protein
MQEEEFNNRFWIPYTTDTCRPYDVSFTACDSTAQYEWHIGAGVYTTRRVELSFGGISDRSIPITLIVRKTPNLKCFPKDDGRDTITRSLYLRKNMCRVYGKYYGAFTDDLTHPFTITIEKKTAPPDYINFALNSCGDSNLVQTSGWPFPHSHISGTYPCGSYSGIRELIFNVQVPDTTLNGGMEYDYCVSLLDTTFKKISISVSGHVPKQYGSTYYNYFKKTFSGLRQ